VLARALGVSLGKTHYLLKALLDKGLVKVNNFRRSDNKLAYAYLLTPSGIAAKLDLTRAFLRLKEDEYRLCAKRSSVCAGNSTLSLCQTPQWGAGLQSGKANHEPRPDRRRRRPRLCRPAAGRRIRQEISYDRLRSFRRKGRRLPPACRSDRGGVGIEDLRTAAGLDCTTDPRRLAEADFVVVAVPTPVDAAHRPDLGPLTGAAETVGSHMKAGATVIYESTVYPGATEEVCIPRAGADLRPEMA
jgi:EPS-associated MarR family transcriptional regulator